MTEETDQSFEKCDKLLRETFLDCLDAVKEIKPNTLEWTFVWNCLLCFKKYAEGRDKDEKSPNP